MRKKQTPLRPPRRLKFNEPEDRAFEIRRQRNLQFGPEIEAWACEKARREGYKSTSALYFELVRQAWHTA